MKGHAEDPHNLEVDRRAKETLENSIQTLGAIIDRPIVDRSDDDEIAILRNNLKTDASLAERFKDVEGELYYVDPHLPAYCRQRLFVPSKARTLLLRIAHDDPIYGGHLGIKKTRAKLAQYYWPSMNAEIEQYIRSCETCQHFKTPKGSKPGLHQAIPTSNLFERLHINIIRPIKATQSGHRYILTAVDAFSRYAYAKAYRVHAKHVIEFLQTEIISKHGVPDQLVSDNGCQFTSFEFKAFIRELNMKHSRTCDYHPQANDLDERFNGSLVKILRNYTDTN